MNILIVTYHNISGVGGGTFASKAFINAFSEICDKTVLLYPIKSKNEPNDLNDNVIRIPVEYNISKLKKFINLCHGKTHRYYEIFEEVIKQEHFDYVIFDNSCASFGLIDIAHKYRAKVITIHHNYEFEYTRDSNVGLLKFIKLYWVKQYEKQSLIKSDLNLTLTEQDKKLLAKNYNVDENKIEVIGCFEFKKKEYNYINTCTNNTFVITGNLSARQTEKSIIPWLNTYYPILKKYVPDSNLVIAGKHPSKKIKLLCKKLKVTLIDTPQSMDDVLNTSRYYICPTSLGGGIKLRVMDGFSHGLPVLTHKVSARGYDVFKNLYLFEYDSIQSFISALRNMMSKKYDYKLIIKEYSDNFSYESGINKIPNILYKLEKNKTYNE